jgi:N6-L-threonylcarbamoyladenine synthase/protein kinase Bud32
MSSESNYYILGIEGTAHTNGIGIVDSQNNILADIRTVFKPKTGGIHPREAAINITENFLDNINKAFDDSSLDPKDISAIAFSRGPGLGPCLRATATGARSLSLALNIPLIAVNHPVAHIELAKQICKVVDPMTVYVSGGNTQIAIYSDHKYVILGETHDLAIGNLIDQTARAIGYDFALAGPIVEQQASLSNKKILNLPYSVKGTTLHYSGLFTALVNCFKSGENPKDICYSLQEYAFSMLAEIVEKSLLISKKNDLLITGGVAANNRLKEMIQEIANENNVSLQVVPKKLAGDNGVMIAVTGALYFKKKKFTDIENSFIIPDWRLDEVEIPW